MASRTLTAVCGLMILLSSVTKSSIVVADVPAGCADNPLAAGCGSSSCAKCSGTSGLRGIGWNGKSNGVALHACQSGHGLPAMLSGFSTSNLPWVGDQLLVIPMEQSQHYPYQTREWYYYFRPYNFRHYREQQTATHAQSRRDLPYSNGFFQDIYRNHEATRTPRLNEQRNYRPAESIPIPTVKPQPPYDSVRQTPETRSVPKPSVAKPPSAPYEVERTKSSVSELTPEREK